MLAVSKVDMVRSLSLCRADKVLLGAAAVLLGSGAVFGVGTASLALPTAALATVLADGVFRPSSGLLYRTLCRGPADRRQVALTFDDGPHPEQTPRVLDALARFQAHATFFVIGRHLERNQALARRMNREGHELGNHSWSHSYFQNFYPAGRYGADIDRAATLIQEVSGKSAPPLYRPPVGLKSPALARAAHARGLSIVAWSLHARDTFKPNPSAVAMHVLRRIRAGDIVLMHDGHDREGAHRTAAVAALPAILKGLRERGLEPVTVTELMSVAS